MEASPGQLRGHLVLLVGLWSPKSMGFILLEIENLGENLENFLGKSLLLLLLLSLAAGQRQEELALSGSWCPAGKMVFEGRKLPVAYGKKKNPWKR